MKPIIFLDRDGTINIDDAYVHQKEQFRWITGVREAMRNIVSLGYDIVIVSNQSGIARGYFGWKELLELEFWMRTELSDAGIEILDFWYCPHHPEYSGRCFCRKPSPRLFHLAIEEYKATERESWMVGDALRDLIAAEAAGLQVAGVLTGREPEAMKNSSYLTFANLEKFANFLIKG